jgi:two-component system, OmpR family, response regulator VicR
MSQGSASDPLVEARADVRALAELTRFHQIHIQTLAAAAERDVLSARKALACALGAPEPGIHVVTAANGVEALLKAREMRPLVIIMDVNMPILDGVQATRLLKHAATTRHARVIACTGDPAFESQPRDDLFAAVLLKPVSPQIVVETAREVAAR